VSLRRKLRKGMEAPFLHRDRKLLNRNRLKEFSLLRKAAQTRLDTAPKSKSLT
jgi:hypothetical protein